MKRIALYIFLFFAAVAISPILIGEKGYILIAMGDYTIESTVVTAGLLLIVVFISLIMTLKIFKGSFNFSLGAWNKLRFANQRKALKNLNQGIAAYIMEDNQQAEHLLVKSAEPSKFSQIAYLMAASAADKQGLSENTKHYLSQLESSQSNVKQIGLESLLVTLQLLLNHQSYQQARTLLDEHHKDIGHDDRLLQLEIELSLHEQRYAYVVEKLVNARKSKTIADKKIELWETTAFYQVFNQEISDKDHNALTTYWNNINRKVKQRPTVVLAYCRVLAEHNITQPLAKILLPLLKKGKDQALLKQIRLLPLTNTDELIQAIQKHLHHDQHNALWLSLLAHISHANQQADLAEKAFNTLVHLPDEQYDSLDLKVFAQVLEKQGQDKKALEVMHKLVG